MKEAIALTHRLARLLISVESKVRIIRKKVLAKGLYGARVCPVTLLKLKIAIKHALGASMGHKSSDLTFAVSSHGSDLGPEVVIFCRRIVFIRCTLVKKPHLTSVVTCCWRRYKDCDYIATDTVKTHSGQCDVAPPLVTGSRANWKPFFPPFGPVGILLDQLHCLGASLDCELAIHTNGEVAIEIMHCPWQSLRPAVQDLARRARTEAAQGSREECNDLYERRSSDTAT